MLERRHFTRGGMWNILLTEKAEQNVEVDASNIVETRHKGRDKDLDLRVPVRRSPCKCICMDLGFFADV